MLGDAGVGKTSLVRCWQHRSSEPAHPTIGVDFHRLRSSAGVELGVWDTAGQERYRSLSTSYLRAPDAAVLVYDVSTAATFASVPNWAALVPDCPAVVLVGNKTDRTRSVATRQGEGMAASLAASGRTVDFEEVSALRDEDAQRALERLISIVPHADHTTEDERAAGTTGSSCCPS